MSDSSNNPTAGGTTRFAPSPTGFLHLGHAWSAKVARDLGDQMILRIEDVDQGRCRPEFEQAIFDDLTWLGITWDGPVWKQSERLDIYNQALQKLKDVDVLYPCFCSRKDIASITAAPHYKDHGPDGPLYPGTCRGLSAKEIEDRSGPDVIPAWRLDSAKAAAMIGPLTYEDTDLGTIAVDPGLNGDVVLTRKDGAVAYHLSCVIDDAAQGVDLVSRGRDLIPAAHIHRVLQALLSLPAPRYHHHALVVDEEGRRLSKRDDDVAIRTLRSVGLSPSQVFDMAEKNLNHG